MKLVTEEKPSLPEAARRLSLAPSTLSYWVKAYKGGKLGEIGKTQRPLTKIERSRCPVGDDERIAASLPITAGEANSERISQRVLCLAGPAIIKVGAGRNEAGGRDQSGA